MRTTTRKTTFCTWPTATRASTGSEWWKPADGSSWTRGRGRGVGREREGSPVEDDRGKNIWKHDLAHTITTFPHTQLIFFCCLLGPGRKHVRTELADWLW